MDGHTRRVDGAVRGGAMAKENVDGRGGSIKRRSQWWNKLVGRRSGLPIKDRVLVATMRGYF